MPILSFNPAYPSRNNPILPEQKRLGLDVGVPGGIGPAPIPSIKTYNPPKRKFGVKVPGGQHGCIDPNPVSLDRTRDVFYKNSFNAIVKDSLNFIFHSAKPYKNDTATKKYSTTGSGLFSWTRNATDSGTAPTTDIPVGVVSKAIGTMHSEHLYATRRFGYIRNDAKTTPTKPNQIGRITNQVQQQSPTQRFLTRYVNATVAGSQRKANTLPVIPHAALGAK